MKTCMFLCFYVNFEHESTKMCMFLCIIAYLYIIMVKGLFNIYSAHLVWVLDVDTEPQLLVGER